MIKDTIRGMKRSALAAFVALPILLYLAGCSLDYDSVLPGDGQPDSIPSIALYEAQFIIVRTSGSRLEVTAGTIELFSKRDFQVFTDASFVELDSDETLVNRGTADQVVYFYNSGNVELKGNVEFYSSEQQATIFAENIIWKDEERTLTSGADDRIEVIKESGDRLSGRGLHADMRRRTIELAEEVNGSLIVDEQADNEDEGADNEGTDNEGADNEDEGENEDENEDDA